MAVYNIYNIYEDEYVAVISSDEGPSDRPDGQININTDGEWAPGSMAELNSYLCDKAVSKWLELKNASGEL